MIGAAVGATTSVANTAVDDIFEDEERDIDLKEKWREYLASGISGAILGGASAGFGGAVLSGAGCRLQVSDGSVLAWAGLLVPVRDAPLRQIIGSHFYEHFVAREDSNSILSHLAGRMRNNLMAVFKFNAERCIRQQLAYRSRKLQ